MWDPLPVPRRRQCTGAMEVAWWSLGTLGKGMGLKEAEWVISSNHNKGRALGPSRLRASTKKELLCWKIKSLSLALFDPNSVTDPHSSPLIY